MTLENFIYESVSEILNGGYEEVKNSIERELPGIVVLSSAEITPEIKLESLGGIEIE